VAEDDPGDARVGEELRRDLARPRARALDPAVLRGDGKVGAQRDGDGGEVEERRRDDDLDRVGTGRLKGVQRLDERVDARGRAVLQRRRGVSASGGR
jgi:hypothetical protein